MTPFIAILYPDTIMAETKMMVEAGPPIPRYAKTMPVAMINPIMIVFVQLVSSWL